MTIDVTAWSSDIELALTRLTNDQIADRDYWFTTVDRIEAGQHPTDNRPITVSELAAWVERCKRTPEDEDQPRQPHAENRRILHPKS